MGDIFDLCDELGPTKVVHIHEPSVGLKAIVVVDNVAAGPAIGGLRMAPDVSAQECRRLARAMTLKNASAGLPHGGGKSVLYGDPKMPRSTKETLIRALACAIRDLNDYIIGPDMGTDETCMAWVHDEIGRSVGLPREIGGIPLDDIGATGWGVANAAEVAAEQLGMSVEGARIVVQGFGAVGMHSARFLSRKGAVLVAASDSRAAVHSPNGIDVDALIELKRSGRSVEEYSNGDRLDREGVIDVECEIWIPAARPDVINEDNVERLNTKLVVEGANIPVTAAAQTRLQDKGIVCIPDFIANAGGVICAAMEYAGASESMVVEAIAGKLRRNTARVLEQAQNRGEAPRAAAMRIARERVRRAMDMRRWTLYG